MKELKEGIKEGIKGRGGIKDVLSVYKGKFSVFLNLFLTAFPQYIFAENSMYLFGAIT